MSRKTGVIVYHSAATTQRIRKAGPSYPTNRGETFVYSKVYILECV
jgi:hypothetical protein